jgi:hypothetical protein
MLKVSDHVLISGSIGTRISLIATPLSAMVTR